MTQKIIRTGNSAAVTVPAEFVAALSLQVGDRVEVRMDYTKGIIVYQFPSSRQLPLAERGRGGLPASARRRQAGRKKTRP